MKKRIDESLSDARVCSRFQSNQPMKNQRAQGPAKAVTRIEDREKDSSMEREKLYINKANDDVCLRLSRYDELLCISITFEKRY